MGVGASPTLRPPIPLGKTRYLFYKRLGGPQGRVGRADIGVIVTLVKLHSYYPVLRIVDTNILLVFEQKLIKKKCVTVIDSLI